MCAPRSLRTIGVFMSHSQSVTAQPVVLSSSPQAVSDSSSSVQKNESQEPEVRVKSSQRIDFFKVTAVAPACRVWLLGKDSL